MAGYSAGGGSHGWLDWTPLSETARQSIAQSNYPQALFSQNYAPSGQIYSQYRTWTNPTTGEVVPTSWGSNDPYGNYRAAYINPGYTSNFQQDVPVGYIPPVAAPSVPTPSVPTPSYIPHSPFSQTPTPVPAPVPEPAPAPPSAPSPPPTPATPSAPSTQPGSTLGDMVAKGPTAWDLWKQQSAAPLANAPPTTVDKPVPAPKPAAGSKKGSTLGQAVISGGISYPQGNFASDYNQSVQGYQNTQNYYQMMLQKLAQESGGSASYVPGATG
jgi:hypothetical protein